jgi:site-specific DNA-methyltransferase (adenine-specific)
LNIIYKDKWTKLIHGDCIDIMSSMIEQNIKVNMILVDPPYGINHHSNRRKDKTDMTTRKGISNDKDNQELLINMIDLSYQCLNDNSHIYWFTRWDKLDEQMPMLKKYYNIKNVLIWDKGNHGSGDLTGAYGNRYECIIYGMKGRRDLNIVDGKQRHEDILEYSKVPASKLIHPHQKPVELLEFLILKSSNENEILLDFACGSGSTLEAARNKNRKCYGIELEEDECLRAKERLERDKT